MSKWLRSKEFRDKYGISIATLWRRVNVAHTIKNKTIGGVMFYLDEEKDDVLELGDRIDVIYCRVSSDSQTEDLNKQESCLREYCVKNGIKISRAYKDISDGLTLSRDKFNELLNDVLNNKIDVIYIAGEDRLSIDNYDFFVNLFKQYGTKLECVGLSSVDNYKEEIKDDIIKTFDEYLR